MSRQEPPPALRGGSRGYEPATRICALALQQTGFSHLAVPAVSSINRWARDGTARQPQTGGVVRYTLVGEHLFLLAVCRLLYPKCQADEVACFIAQNSANPIFYSRQQITERERELGLTRKKGSTTAWQALTAYNIKRRQLFWTFAYPIGVFGISRHDLIDIDEAGLWLEKKNPTFGKALSSVRVRAPGVYGHGEKWTLILAINCAGFRYIRFEKVAGTTVEIYRDYVTDVVAALPQLGALNFKQYTIMHDNLGAHKEASVCNAITAAGHRVICRPAYRPVDGPIEYVFNQLQGELTNRMNEVTDEKSFVALVYSVITNLHGFDETFVHCGYT